MAAVLELTCDTMRQANLSEFVATAAEAGFGAVTSNPKLFTDTEIAPKAFRKLVEDTGLIFTGLDGFGSGLPGIPTTDAELAPFRNYFGRDVSHAMLAPEEDFFRLGEALGAKWINAIHLGGDPATPKSALVDALGGICRRGAARGFEILVEFVPGNAIPSLAVAADLVAQVAAPNLGITFDSRHWARSGGTMEEIAKHAALFGATQFSDLNWATKDDPNRLLPGDGELPLVEMLRLIRAARPDTPIGVEVISDPLFAIPPIETARLNMRGLRSIMDRA